MTKIDLPIELWQRIGRHLDAMSLVQMEIAFPQRRDALRKGAWGPGTSDWVPRRAIPLNHSLAWRDACIKTWPQLKPSSAKGCALTARDHLKNGATEDAITIAQPLARQPHCAKVSLEVLIDALNAQGRVCEANLLGVRLTLQTRLSTAVGGGDAAAVAALLAAGARATSGDLAGACEDGHVACVDALAQNIAQHNGWDAAGPRTRMRLGYGLLNGKSAGSALALMRSGLPPLPEEWWREHAGELCPASLLQGLKEQATAVECRQVAQMLNLDAMVLHRLKPPLRRRAYGDDAEYCLLLAQIGGLDPMSARYIAQRCLDNANWPVAHACLQTLVRSGLELAPLSWRLIYRCEYTRFALLPRLQDMVKLGFNVNDFHKGQVPDGDRAHCPESIRESDSILHIIGRSRAPDAQECIIYMRSQGAKPRHLKSLGWPGDELWVHTRQEEQARRRLLQPTITGRMKCAVSSAKKAYRKIGRH